MTTPRKAAGWHLGHWQQRIALLFPLAVFWMSGISAYRALRPLDSFDVLHRRVLAAKVIQDDSRAHPYIVAFKLVGDSSILGVYAGQDSTSAYRVARQLYPGSSVKVYYDKHGSVSNGINLHVYQIESADKTIVAISDVQRADSLAAVGTATIGMLFLGAVYLARRNTTSA